MTGMLLLLACGPGTVDIDTKPHGGTDSDAEQLPGETGETAEDTQRAESPVEGVTITVHPDVATVLVVDWTARVPADAAWLTWSLEGDAYSSTPQAVAAGAAQDVVLGVPADTAVDVTLHVTADGVTTDVPLDTATTGPLPDALIAPTLALADPIRMRPEPYLLTSVNVGPANFYGPCYVVILDAAARIVWYRAVSDSRLTIFPRVTRGRGALIWEATTYYSFGGEPSVTRATLDLRDEVETDVDAMGLTFDEMEDGSILFDENIDGYQYNLTRQYPDGTRERIWECFPWMVPYTYGYWMCAPNTVAWYPERNSILWSTFETSTVAEIDLDSGEVVRAVGEHPDSYTFDPPEAALELQHYPNWTADGTLIVSTHVPGQPHTQYAREFEIDDDAGVAHEVWSYTPDAGYYAAYAGQVQKLPTGNVLWQLGTEGVIQEVTPDGDVVWEIDWANHLTGNATPIADLYALQSGW